MKHLTLKLSLAAVMVLFGSFHGKLLAVEGEEKPPQVSTGEYKARSFSNLFGMKGFSDGLLSMHFKLYEGYVKNTNLLRSKLAELSNQKKDRTPEYAGLKRMYGWEFDGMRLHEYYFENLGGDGKLDTSSSLHRQLSTEFGSYEKWRQDFLATGMIRGIGWAILYLDGKTGKLTNAWINEHDLGHLAGAQPLLVMDVFEHAYLPDYGLDRNRYIDAFFDNIDWSVVTNRFQTKAAQ